MKRISVIVPVLNEEERLRGFLAHLDPFPMAELILVDGGSHDKTGVILREWANIDNGTYRRVVASAPRSRGAQMNEGAKHATGDILLFLHADSGLPEKGFEAILNALQSLSTLGGAFRLRIDSPLLLLKIISMMANMRSLILKLPYGDQGYFVRRETFLKVGGFSQMPLMEDIDFFRRLNRQGRVVLLKESLNTSARRWIQYGVAYTSFRNIVLFFLYYLGVSPMKLARWYYS